MDGLTILYIVAAVVTIGTPLYFLFRRMRQKETTADPIAPPLDKRLGDIEAKLGRITEYLDGLPQAAPAVRGPFEKGLEQYRKAEYREAIRLFEASFQPEATDSNRAALHILVGNCFAHLSELEEAEGHYRQAEALARQVGDRRGLAVALVNMAGVYYIRGELHPALEHYQKALEIHADTGYRQGEASALGNIGSIYRLKGELGLALEHYQRALRIHRDIGYREGEANALGNLGLVYQDKGDPGKAREYLAQALRIFEEIGAAPEVEQTRRNIERIKQARAGKRSRK